MLERFTDRARKAIRHANTAADKLGHASVGTEHLLLGLLKVQDGVAALALKNCGVSSDAVLNEVNSLMGRNDQTAESSVEERLDQLELGQARIAQTLGRIHSVLSELRS